MPRSLVSGECTRLHGLQETPENVVDQECCTTIAPPVMRRQTRASGTTVALEECFQPENNSLTDSDASVDPYTNTVLEEFLPKLQMKE